MKSVIKGIIQLCVVVLVAYAAGEIIPKQQSRKWRHLVQAVAFGLAYAVGNKFFSDEKKKKGRKGTMSSATPEQDNAEQGQESEERCETIKIKCEKCLCEFEPNGKQEMRFCPHCGCPIDDGSSDSSIVKLGPPVLEKKTLAMKILSRIFDIHGRANRLEFWLTVIISAIIVTSIFLIAAYHDSNNLFSDHKNFENLSLFLLFFFIAATIPVSIRRLHDVGMSGWWYPLILFFLRDDDESEKRSNRYGPPPVGKDSFDYSSILGLLESFGISGAPGKILAGIIFMTGCIVALIFCLAIVIRIYLWTCHK
ncbi:MAG: DUF805 domain-containing protein [Lentisphaeria bacterium]|nr:DUF805 domain-containing protein [Lentisphaeria bacterium]